MSSAVAGSGSPSEDNASASHCASSRSLLGAFMAGVVPPALVHGAQPAVVAAASRAAAAAALGVQDDASQLLGLRGMACNTQLCMSRTAATNAGAFLPGDVAAGTSASSPRAGGCHPNCTVTAGGLVDRGPKREGTSHARACADAERPLVAAWRLKRYVCHGRVEFCHGLWANCA